jgi:hypothetical protein
MLYISCESSFRKRFCKLLDLVRCSRQIFEYVGSGLRVAEVEKAKERASLWLASNPSRRWGELFFLAYSPFWIVLCLGVVVPLQLYEVLL